MASDVISEQREISRDVIFAGWITTCLQPRGRSTGEGAVYTDLRGQLGKRMTHSAFIRAVRGDFSEENIFWVTVPSIHSHFVFGEKVLNFNSMDHS